MNTRPVTALALVQLLLIVLIFFAVGAGLKLWGYPDSASPLPRLPLLFREHLFLWILLPIAWTSFTLRAYARDARSYPFLLGLGVLFAVALTLSGFMAVMVAFKGPPLL